MITCLFWPPRASVTDTLSEQVVCPDTRPPRSPALAAPPQRARWLCCAVGATATPHLRGEDAHATNRPHTPWRRVRTSPLVAVVVVLNAGGGGSGAGNPPTHTPAQQA